MNDPARLGLPAIGRVPPNELDAEGYVISWAILTEGDIDRVVSTGLLPAHFYSSANRIIWESIVRLSFEAGMHVDLISVAGDLRSLGKLDQVGDTPYLAELAAEFPVEPRPGILEQHCRSIIAAWTARQVQSVAQETIARLYEPQGVPRSVLIDEHEQKIWELAHAERETVYGLAGVIASDALNELADALRNGRALGVTTGFSELDKKTGGYQKGHLGIIAGRAGMGKSSALTSSLIRSTRLPKDGSLPKAAYLHSLEMPKEEVALRLVCIEANVEYHKIRQNLLSSKDWERLFIAADTLGKQPLLIGDKPGLTVHEFRSIVRKIKREIDQGRIPASELGIGAIDYLQLMTGDKSQSRELEVSSTTKGLKNTSKSESVCVIALSQVNRAPEKKVGDKRPTLADLRECLAGDQWVYDARSGARVQIKDLAAGTQVTGLAKDWKLRPGIAKEVWSTGIKPVVKMTTHTGRTLRATDTHPVRTIDGWRMISEVSIGEKIAVPRSVPEPTHPSTRFTYDELAFLGYMISDGTYLRNRSCGYVKQDPAPVNEVRRIALERFGVIAKDHKCPGSSQQIELTVTGCGPGANPVIQWLKGLGIHDQLGPQKTIPEEVLAMDNAALGRFLAALWVGDGSVVKKKKSGWTLKFTSTSFKLLDQVMWILTRLGIVAVHGPSEFNSKSKVPIASITIHDQVHIRRFAEVAPMIGIKGAKLRKAAATVMKREKPGIDRLPLSVNEMIRTEKQKQCLTYKSMGWVVQGIRGKHISRPNLLKVATTLASQELTDLATSDVLWDTVESVVPDGEEEVFDVSVPGLGNFIAQNICVHNSGAIENDADWVWFVYRDQYYNKDSGNEAEIIIAKQRGGATGTVMLAFHGPTISFRPLETGYEEFHDFGDNGDPLPPDPDQWYHR